MTGSSGHETQILWQYVGSFTLYTLLAIGVMYGAYFWIKGQGSFPGGLASGLPKGLAGLLKLPASPTVQNPIQIESRLSLELRKQLYIIRCGSERFLIATSNEGTQLISKLDESKTSDSSALFPPEGGTTIINNPVKNNPAKTSEDTSYGAQQNFFSGDFFSRALAKHSSSKKSQQSPPSRPQPAFFF
jgi:flagellar biogenesis protein FliO